VAHLLALVILVGLVDSANPSTIAPALYLAAGKEAHRGLLGFIAGGFAVNLAGGILLAIGPGQAALAIVPHPGDEVLHLLELAAGGITLVLAAGLWLVRGRVAHHVEANKDRIDRSSLLVGGGIMLVELPTAVPYFAVIAAVVGSGRGLPTQIALLAIFNGVLFLPLVAILAVRSLASERGRALLERRRAGIDRRLSTLVPLLVLVVSIVLIAVGAVGALHDR
jgi:Sap, sulfolipid-1-addressing protein